jgi:hypothetical protein
MALLPSSEKKEVDELSNKKNSPSNFMIWLKKMTSFFRRSQKAVTASRIKKDIDRLEEERNKEHAALLKQRHFYEGLLRKKTTTTDVTDKKIADITDDKPIIKEEIKEIEPVVKEEIIKSEPIIKEKVSSVVKSVLSVVKFSKPNSLAKKLAIEREEEASVRTKNEVEGRSWQAYNGVKANLVKDQGVLFFNWKEKVLALVLSLVLCCLAISLVYVGLLIWQKERLNDNKTTLANYDAINLEISKNEKEIQEIIDFNKKLDVVNYLLSNHVYWSNFFSFLENNTLKNVYFTSFSGDLTGKYKIPTIARNLDAISMQLEVMKAYNMVRSIQYSAAQTINSSSGSSTVGPTSSTVKFVLEVSVDPKIFLK